MKNCTALCIAPIIPLLHTRGQLSYWIYRTFRRHLKVGVTRVADILWQREIS